MRSPARKRSRGPAGGRNCKCEHRDSTNGREQGRRNRANSAGGGAEGNEHNREAGHTSERRCEQAGAREFALAELLPADAGEHGNVTWEERKYTGRKKRNQACEKSATYGDIRHRCVPVHDRGFAALRKVTANLGPLSEAARSFSHGFAGNPQRAVVLSGRCGRGWRSAANSFYVSAFA